MNLAFDIKRWNLLDWVHTKTVVHAGSVGEEACNGRLEEETERENVVAHPLLEQRITSGFANDQISPLDNDDRNEKGSVACELQLLAVFVSLITFEMRYDEKESVQLYIIEYPFLSVGIREIVDGFWVPSLAQIQEVHWPKAIFSHDDEIGKESTKRLHHTNLAVRHGNQSIFVFD